MSRRRHSFMTAPAALNVSMNCCTAHVTAGVKWHPYMSTLVERRLDPEGTGDYYTKDEFVEYFGGTDEWDCSPREQDGGAEGAGGEGEEDDEDDVRPSRVFDVRWFLCCAESQRPVRDIESFRAKERIAWVCDALEDKGWAEVDRKNVTIEKDSKGANNDIWKLIAPGSVAPEKVALHWNKFPSQRVCVLARNLFGELGLGPRQLFQEGDFFIEEWEGIGHPTCTDMEEFAQLGALCARVHKIPTDWFDECRSEFLESIPALKNVSEAHTVWPWAAAGDLIDDLIFDPDAEGSQAFLKDPFWLPK